jgi:hypothetical protein
LQFTARMEILLQSMFISAATWFNGTEMSMIRDGKAILLSSF